MGDFDYKNDQPELLKTNKGTLADKSGRKVNKHGWLTTPEGHLVDYSGRKRFDRKQTTSDGGIPKLYTYEAKRFDVRDVMGVFEKDLTSGSIVPALSDKGLLDTKGRLCNSKGYLPGAHGNIIDINGRHLWRQVDLQNGEFPKIPAFAKFNLKTIMGDVTNLAELKENPERPLIDHQGRPINESGYLIDANENIINVKGQLVLRKEVLDASGEVPLIFRGGQLRQDTGASLSRLMSEIEKGHPTRTIDSINDQACNLKQEGETSLDSQMEDTPANYNLANQRVMPKQ